jgi:hypothetical protein
MRPPGSEHVAAKAGAFSLVELLLVMAVAGTLLALAAPALLELGPSRKAAAMELSGFLERARTRAMTSGEEVFVAFADGNHPVDSLKFRAFAFFLADGSSGEEEAIAQMPLRQVSEWLELPGGIVFGNASLFEIEPDYSFRTLHDTPAKRAFDVQTGSGAAVSVDFPYLVFSPRGSVIYPSIVDADALNLAIVEGTVNEQGNDIIAYGNRASNGSLRAELIRISSYTGRASILTD